MDTKKITEFLVSDGWQYVTEHVTEITHEIHASKVVQGYLLELNINKILKGITVKSIDVSEQTRITQVHIITTTRYTNVLEAIRSTERKAVNSIF